MSIDFYYFSVCFKCFLSFLAAAVDSWIEEPVRDTDKPFLMSVEDVFTITGRGTVATGSIETGIANTGDAVEIIGMGAKLKKKRLFN